MVRWFWYGIALAAAAALAGAEIGRGAGTILRVRAERGRYTPGESVAVVAANVSRRDVVLTNFCPWRLERADGGAWAPVARSPGPDTACALSAGVLLPGQRESAAVRLPERLPPGRYRVGFEWLTRERGAPLPEADRRTAAFELR